MKDRIDTLRLLQLGGVVAFSLLIPLLVGAWLDGRIGTAPWLALAGVVVGTLSATVGVVRVINAAYRAAATAEPADKKKEDE
jgi:F0F1-type ATP synthase assembly protein I